MKKCREFGGDSALPKGLFFAQVMHRLCTTLLTSYAQVMHRDCTEELTGYAQTMNNSIDRLCTELLTSYAPPGAGVYAQVMHKILTRYKQVFLCRSCRADTRTKHGNTARTHATRTHTHEKARERHGHTKTRKDTRKTESAFIRRFCACMRERMESTHTRTRTCEKDQQRTHQHTSKNRQKNIIANLFRFFLIKIALS